MSELSKVRIDKYLWSIRIFKTRSLASDACEKGRVKLNGCPVKASKSVNIGEEYFVKTEAKNWTIEVLSLIDKRVAYSEAIKHYIDKTPPEEMERIKFMASSFHTGKRLSKIGRPTKKDRRDIDDFYSEDI